MATATDHQIADVVAGRLADPSWVDVDALTDGNVKKFMTTSERAKLTGVAAGATANATDAQLRDRGTHTGPLAISVVTGLQAALDNKPPLVGGVIPTSYLPNLTIANPHVAASQAEMLALPAQRGDIASRTDFTPYRIFILASNSPGILADWIPAGAAGGSINSVNDQFGPNVHLGATDVGAVPITRSITATGALSITGGTTLANDLSFAVADASNTAKGVLRLAGDLAGTPLSPTIAPGVVTTGKLADAAVTSGKLADASVTTGKIADGTITNIDISPTAGIQTSKVAGLDDKLAAMDEAIRNSGGSGGGGGGSAETTLALFVTSDGTTNIGPTIQAALNTLSTSTNRSYQLIVAPLTKSGSMFIDSTVRITTSNTELRFAGPVLLGPNISSDAFGGLSIFGSTPGQTTVTGGAVRGSSKITVASPSGITVKSMIRVADNDTSGGASSGYKAEMAVVVDIAGSTLYLDHPLHHDFTGTITLTRYNAVTNSGFTNLNATFTGQQPRGNVFPMKFSGAQNCYVRNCHFRGDVNNSWSRECVNFRDSYRCIASDSTISFGWDYTSGSTYDYGFSADNATECYWRNCHVSNTRHGFSADKGSCGLIYMGCTNDNGNASGFDLHGGWARDITYVGCHATASDTRNAGDGQKQGFIAGNTSFLNGNQNITYLGCTARGFGNYTDAGGDAGDGIGFEIVDGCSGIRIIDCKVIDSMYGIFIASEASIPPPGSTVGVGAPIKDVTVEGCEFNNIGVGAVPLPWITKVASGATNHGINGLRFRNNTIVNNTATGPARLYGNSTSLITGLVVEGNTWQGPGLAGVWVLDVQYASAALVHKNTFTETRRGVTIQNSPNSAIMDNSYFRLADGATASNLARDAGGNNNLIIDEHHIVGAITSAGTAPSSSNAQVILMPLPRTYTTAGLPPAAAVGRGATCFNSTIGQPVWSTGAQWVTANGTPV